MSFQEQVDITEELTCFHCGDRVRNHGVNQDDKVFCCTGCKVVYELLRENNLYDYYNLQSSPGRSATFARDERFAYLDDPATARKLKNFTDGKTGTVTFHIPQMHCSSCIWLLERLYVLDQSIAQSRVDFLKKEIRIQFSEQKTSVRKIVELLSSLGYEPQITLNDVEKTKTAPVSRSLYYKVGVAGFCFANIMLLSLPEYLSSNTIDPQLQLVFTALNAALALPVFFYCASDFFRSALAGLRKRTITVDVPLALGIFILFARSLYDILAQTGPGFLDSLSGLVFFLLLGRLFQSKTYERLNFERDYKSYFPLAVTVTGKGKERVVPLSSVSTGDRILIRNNEISPADAVLITGNAFIDYSFVTGESRPVQTVPGTLVYAGGRQVGSAIELEIVKNISQSYLTQLWNDAPSDAKPATSVSRLTNTVGKYFTIAVLLLSALAGALWLPVDPARAWNAITGILIVACPCAIALSTPFTFGSALRIFGRNGFFLKNTAVVESLARADSVIFDKTGTITHAGAASIRFVGSPLSARERAMVSALVRNSHHPLSRAIAADLGSQPLIETKDFAEEAGQGLQALVDGVRVKIGSAPFTSGEPVKGLSDAPRPAPLDTCVFLSLDGRDRGFFTVRNKYRDGLGGLIDRLSASYRLYLLSGDTEAERTYLEQQFPGRLTMLFRQSPAEKLSFVRSLRNERRSVVMVGDGLNDAGALRQSNVGIALTEDIAAFSPACDAILEAPALPRLDLFLRFCRTSVAIVFASFALSLLYNIVGLTFAFQGTLSPLIAAVLMPLSSITIVAFTTTAVRAAARRKGML
jgi:Cu+-exporting ATPase